MSEMALFSGSSQLMGEGSISKLITQRGTRRADFSGCHDCPESDAIVQDGHSAGPAGVGEGSLEVDVMGQE